MSVKLQKFDMSKIEDDKVIVLIGKRETGKSFLVKDLIRVFDKKSQIQMVLLIKPQFELEKYEIPKGGVVYLDSLRLKALNKVIESFSNFGQFSFQTVVSTLVYIPYSV